MNKSTVAFLAAVTLGAPSAFAQEPIDPKGRPTLENPPMQDPGMQDDLQRVGGETTDKARGMTDDAKGMTGMLSMEDQMFVRKATEAGLAEVSMAKLALEKAKTPETKRFAEKLLDDHQKANMELKRIAEKKGMTLPTEPDSVQKATMDRMQKMSGAEFERAFMQENVRSHEEAVRLFRNQANMGKDPELKAFAAKTLPTLTQHGDTAKRHGGREHL